MTRAERRFKRQVEWLLDAGVYPTTGRILTALGFGHRAARGLVDHEGSGPAYGLPIGADNGGALLNGRETTWRREVLDAYPGTLPPHPRAGN